MTGTAAGASGPIWWRGAWGRTEKTILVLLVVSFATFGWTAWSSADRTRAIGAEVELVASTQRLLATLFSLESSERGFVLTGAGEFLEPYNQGRATLSDRLSELTANWSNTPADPRTLDDLLRAVASQVDFAGDVVRVRTEQGFQPAAGMVQTGEGKARMDVVRGIIGFVQERANARIGSLGNARRFSGLVSWVAFGGALLAAIVLAGLALRRQREARQTSTLLRAVLLNAPLDVGFLDRDLKAAKLGGVSEASGTTAVDLISGLPADRPDVHVMLREVLDHDRSFSNVEIGAETREGPRHLLVSLFPLRLEAGPTDPVDGVGVVAVDATDRHMAEESLRQSERRFRSLVNATATMLWSASADGIFAGEQPDWAEFTGQSEAEYEGMGWTDAIHPDDRQRSARAWERAIAAGALYSVEHRVRRADGEWRDMLANAVPITRLDGSIGEWIGTHTDITEQKRTASALNESNFQFQGLADNIPQMAWMARPNGEIFWYNKRWFDFTGTRPGETDGFRWSSVHHADHIDRVTAGYRTAISEGHDWEDTFPLRSADGAYRWFLSKATAVREPDGSVRRWFGTNTDVTRQREQERELETARDLAQNANLAKSQFIANMSHELRTPLTAVIGYAEMLEEEVEESGEKHLLTDLRKINQNARHLLKLINDVLDLSKIEAERMEIYAETFVVGEMLEEIASSVGSLIDKNGNSLKLEIAADLGEMHSDQTKLRQCVTNLLSNAAKFTNDGTITFRAFRTAEFGRDWLTFEVEDTGIGMSPEQLERLFQRFTQADASTTRKFGGTGLGLAITKAFAKMLGGDIAVRSREGEGTCFTIKLPAVAVASVVETSHSRPIAASERAASSGVVLAIDDDPHARDLVSRFLTREGFIVRTAADGLAGLEAAKLIRPDVILLDVTMPRMDGWSVLSAVKQDADLSRIPVVMLTVIDEHSLGYALGASDYLLKPVEWDQLRKVMNRFRNADETVVLAVDDDVDLLERTRSILEREGFTVMTAENGRQGLDLVETRIPDLVLTDLVMPEMDGFAFIRALRQRPDTAGVPIVVLTSKDLSRDEFRKLRSQAEEIVPKKNLQLADLAEQIRVIVGGDDVAADAPVAARSSEKENDA